MGAVGRMMIRAGVLILLFVAYQLWGTGLQTDRAQNDLGSQFRERQEQVAGEAPTTTTAPGTAEPSTTLPPSTAPADLPPPVVGQPVGRLHIPDIESDFYVVEGVDLSVLQDGPGHFPGTPLPGQPGNSAIAGHRVTWAAPFNRLDELEPGALINVETLQGTFWYEVMPQPNPGGGEALGHYIVEPTQLEILDDKGDNRLTLMACHPKYSAAQRIVVEAKLTSPPAPPTPAAPPAEASPAQVLLGGDSGAWLPAILWSVAAIGLWVGAWFVGRTWSRWRWPAYAIGLPVFAFLLFQAFAAINLLLPAGY